MIPADRIFRAFADETRLRILHLLTKGELCVCDLTEVLAVPQSKVSRHLGYLKRAGLVKDRRDGLWRHYSLAEPKNAFHERLVGCVGSCLDEAPALKSDAKKLATAKRRRC
ncbi:MAG: metalloregulator ArsR/SmtB family transcription factor [Elusimicrobiota bacterium]|nr:metalloregulator ArsR/SmtB family transcription factor [Elusimicrobiota bacterium]